jgi:hypothetical protein
MIKKGIVLALCVAVLLSASIPLIAQQDPQQSEDQKLDAARKKNLEIKRQIREELEKQNKALEEELNRLRLGSVQPKTPDSTNPQTVAGQNESVIPASLTSPTATNAGNGDGNGNGNPSDPAPATMNPVVSSNPAALMTTTPASTSVFQGTGCGTILLDVKKFSRADQSICFIAQRIVERRMANVGSRGIDPNRGDMTFLLTALFNQLISATPSIGVDPAVRAFVVDVEASRTDKQLGADSRAAGTTSLGVKGGIPQVISWAVENGGGVSSIDGTTLTFRLNPVGFIEGLAGQGYISSFRNTEDDALLKFFRRTSIGFSFDTNRDTDPPTFTGSKRQLSAVSARYQFINQRDPRAERYRKRWDDFFNQEGIEFTNEQTKQLMRLQLSTEGGEFKNADLQNWLLTTNEALKGTQITATLVNQTQAIEEVQRIIIQRLAQLPMQGLQSDTELTGALTAFVAAYPPYLKKKNEIMDEIAKGTLVTFEYTNYREPTAPDLSNFRFIAQKGTGGGFDFSANASLTFFNKRPVGPNVQRLRDFDFSADLDKKFDDVMGLGPATLTFAGKYQRLTSNAVAFDGTVLPNTKGDIAAGQVKLTIPIGQSGIKMPFSITFANRTELVRERETRGNFGFTFDLDTLFARLKSFSQ